MLSHTCNCQTELIVKGSIMNLKAVVKSTSPLHWARCLSLGSLGELQRVHECTAQPEPSTDHQRPVSSWSWSVPFLRWPTTPLELKDSWVFLLESHYIGLFKSSWFSHPVELRILVTWFLFVNCLILTLLHWWGRCALCLLSVFNKEFNELHLLACAVQFHL